MYKVLIVDDETLVRAGLKTTIDWDELGFVVIADAANGEVGYEEYLKSLPDVVFTDIRMPKKDGIWLVKKIKEHNPEVKILVLTCYDEFSYAREALKAGADDYILKSEVEDEELVEIMKKIKETLDQSVSVGANSYEINMNHNNLRTSLFECYIRYNFCETQETQDMCRIIQYDMKNKKNAFVYIHLQNEKNPKEPSAFANLSQVLLNVFFQYLQDKKMDYLYTKSSLGFYILISSERLKEEDIKKAVLSLNKSSVQYFNKELQFLYTPVNDKLNCLNGDYKKFHQATSVFFYNIWTHFRILTAEDAKVREFEITDYVKKYCKEFIEIVNKGDLNEAKKSLNAFREEAILKKYNPQSVKIVFSSLVSKLFEHFRGGLVENEHLKSHETYYEEIIQSKTVDELIECYQKFIVELIEVVNQSSVGHSKFLIQSVQTFIEEHYVEGISLENVAAHMNLSKHYLSTLFKKETGENMTLYINRKKIERAKVLLLNPQYRIQDIVEMVGFSNQQYFSKMFKRITGMTVMEYKGKRRGN